MKEKKKEKRKTKMNEKWILCDNRLPTNKGTWYERSQEYLTCSKTGILQILTYCDGWNCCFVNDNMDVNRDNEIKDIIAWMPLPEPIMKEVEND